MNLILTDWVHRHHKLVTWVIATVLCYMVAYFVLSRVSLTKAKMVGIDAFYYVPVNPRQIADNRTLEELHFVGIVLFYPLWWVDNSLGGPHYGNVPLTEISNPRPEHYEKQH